MRLSDAHLERLKEMTLSQPDMVELWCVDLEALIARLMAAELKDCNQYHCGHATCNRWREVADR